MDTLPTEIIYMIVSLLPLKDNIAFLITCSSLYRLLHDKSFEKEISRKITFDDCFKFSNPIPWLKLVQLNAKDIQYIMYNR